MNTDQPSTENDETDSPAPDTREVTPETAGNGAAEAASEEKSVPPEPSDTPVAASKGGRSFLAFLAFVFALLALGGTAWMWWQDSLSRGQEEERVFAEIARLESSNSELNMKIQQLRQSVSSLPATDSSAEVAAMNDRLQAGIAQLEQIERSVNEQIALSRSLQMASDSQHRRLQAAESAVAGVASRELDATHDLDLAEIDYLLRLANERLELFHDPIAADETLKLADMHLAAMNNPIYLAVRQDIAAARQSLTASDIPDFFAIGSEIDELQQSIGKVPFKGDEQLTETPQQEQAEGWWGKVKSVFSDLVTVRRSTDLEDERISLEDHDYVRQRLWLQLEIAHLALMRRDQAAFRQSLQRVRSTQAQWFEESSNAYRNMDQSIESLMNRDIQVTLPDISKPWSTLQQLRTLRAIPVAAPAVEPADPPVPDEETPTGETDG